MQVLIFHVTKDDLPYLPILKVALSGRAQTYIINDDPITVGQYALLAKKKNAAGVVTSSPELLKLLVPEDKNPKLSNYAGSLLRRRDTNFLVVDPLSNLVTVTYGKFIFERFISKLLAPNKWFPEPPFSWELFTPAKIQEYMDFFHNSDLIAIDIETIRDDPERAIECISFTGVMIDGLEIAFRTVVVPCDSLFNIIFIRNVCGTLPPKTLQNGKYDIAYLLRFGCPITNYLFDTLNLFHSWLSELPKDLGFISSMMVRSYSYHKDEGGGTEKYARYSYNAKDTYYTCISTLALLCELPPYAHRNYEQEFPLSFPCILSEHTGIKYDSIAAGKNRGKVEESRLRELKRLQVMVNCPTFNPGSWQQTQKLFAMLGSKDVTSTDKKAQDKVAFRHPLNKVIISRIAQYREDSKENGSYYKNSIPWLGRCFYALNPFGTDTGRLSSRESQFWCGLQIQNIKRDDDDTSGANVKDTLIADTGFYMGEADFSQNEARGTAYLSGDTALIEAVDDPSTDFHGLNASKFFGVPYSEIVISKPSVIDQEGRVLEWVHKVINKALRDLSKRTNHGANYNMGPQVMLDTMGIEKVLRAKQLLKLPRHWTLIKVTEYLLDVFSKTYPIMKGAWYDKCIADVENTGTLVGPTGWTRKCFGKPSRSKGDKRALNAYVAHPPQSLAAMVLNKAYMRVFYEVYLPNPKDFKLHAQIHDSILFSYRIGFEHLAWKVKECMDISIPVKDTFGVERVLRVPVDLKGQGARWSELIPLKRMG